jgi:hypothetical protein
MDRPLSNHPLYSSNTNIDIILSGFGLGLILHFGLYTNAGPKKIGALLIEYKSIEFWEGVSTACVYLCALVSVVEQNCQNVILKVI